MSAAGTTERGESVWADRRAASQSSLVDCSAGRPRRANLPEVLPTQPGFIDGTDDTRGQGRA